MEYVITFPQQGRPQRPVHTHISLFISSRDTNPERCSGARMEAPLVSLDEEFEDLRPCCSEEPEEKPRCLYGSSPHHLEDPSLSELENFSSEIISFKSMEDLVNEFDEKLNVCFRNYNAKTENLAPVKNQFQIQEEEETLQDEE